MKAFASAARPVSELLRVFTGPLVWFAHFVIAYGTEAILCTPAAGAPRLMTGLLAIATALAFAALGAFAWSMMPRHRAPATEDAAFLRVVALALAALSLLGVIWTTLPALSLPACASPAG